MSCPTRAQFEALIPDPNADVCSQLGNYMQMTRLVSNLIACIYNEDGTFTTEFAEKICATGCGGGSTTSTTSSSTTTSGGSSGEQLYSAAGTYEFTVPVGVTEVTITTIGGGGGGGGRASPFSFACADGGPVLGVASGGGSGEKRSGAFPVTPGEVLTVIVGAGGGQDSFGAGIAGSPTYVVQAGGNIILSNGGNGGVRGCCASGPFSGGTGGSGGSGGTGTNGLAGGATTASPGCANGSAGASVGLSAGAGSAGNVNDQTHPASAGATQIVW